MRGTRRSPERVGLEKDGIVWTEQAASRLSPHEQKLLESLRQKMAGREQGSRAAPSASDHEVPHRQDQETPEPPAEAKAEQNGSPEACSTATQASPPPINA